MSPFLTPLIGFDLGFFEIAVLGTIAVMLFGKRLPEVARQVGAQYRDLRRHISTIQSEFTSATKEVSNPARKAMKSITSIVDDVDDADQPTAPKFEPPPEEEIIE